MSEPFIHHDAPIYSVRVCVHFVSRGRNDHNCQRVHRKRVAIRKNVEGLATLRLRLVTHACTDHAFERSKHTRVIDVCRCRAQ